MIPGQLHLGARATLVQTALALVTRFHHGYLKNLLLASCVRGRGLGRAAPTLNPLVPSVLAVLLTWLVFSSCAVASTVGGRWTPVGAPELQVVCRSEELRIRMGNQIPSELRLIQLPLTGYVQFPFVSGVVTESTPNTLALDALASLELPGRWNEIYSFIGSSAGVEKIRLRAGNTRFPTLGIGARIHFSFELIFAGVECWPNQDNEVRWVRPDEVIIWDDLDAPLLYHYRSAAIAVNRNGHVRGGPHGVAPLNISRNTRKGTPPHPLAQRFRLQPEWLALRTRKTKCAGTTSLRVRHEKSSRLSCLGQTVPFSVADHEMEFVFLGADLWDLEHKGREAFFADGTPVGVAVAFAYWRSR